MSNISNNFGSVKNLRVWLNTLLSKSIIAESGEKAKYFLYRKVGDSEQICYNVDLIWDGTNYHITYTDTDTIEENTKFYVLPFTYTDDIVWSIRAKTDSKIETEPDTNVETEGETS